MSRLKKFVLWTIGIIVISAFILFLVLRYYIAPQFEEKSAKNKLTLKEGIEQNYLDTIYKYTHHRMPNQSEIAIAMIDNDQIVYYGFERRKDILIQKENSKSFFQIGSISKVFTSALLADLVYHNEVNLDSTIDRYLGYPLNSNLKLSLKSLANHTSGLNKLPTPWYMDILNNDEDQQPYRYATESWMDSFLRQSIEIVESQKGTSNYSNVGASVLGYTLGKYKKTEYDVLVKERIFNRYKMPNSFIYKSSDSNRMVKAYVEGSKMELWDFNKFNPCGGIASNLIDMSQFVLANLDSSNQALALTHLPTYSKDPNMKTGLGWFLIKNESNHRWLFHNGSTLYHTSSMIIDLDTKKGIVLLSNTPINILHQYQDALTKALLIALNTHKVMK